MSVKKLVKFIMIPIDEIEVYNEYKKLLYTVKIEDLEKCEDIKLQLFSIYETEEKTVLEIVIQA